MTVAEEIEKAVLWTAKNFRKTGFTKWTVLDVIRRMYGHEARFTLRGIARIMGLMQKRRLIDFEHGWWYLKRYFPASKEKFLARMLDIGQQGLPFQEALKLLKRFDRHETKARVLMQRLVSYVGCGELVRLRKGDYDCVVHPDWLVKRRRAN